MSTISEIEKAVPQLSPEELTKLEEVIRQARRDKERAGKPSLRNIEPVSVGKILQPLGTRDQWYDEMREGRA
jgi:hypothetical protein